MGTETRPLVTHSFHGGRFEDHGLGLDLDCLPELNRYKQILVETAKQLWHRKHPDAKRLPNNFEQSMTIKLTGVSAGSVCVELSRENSRPDGTSRWEPLPDELEEAAMLVAETLEAVSANRAIPEAFPKEVLRTIAEYGKTLRPDEFIEHSFGRNASVRRTRYDADVKARLMAYLERLHDDTVDLIGTVTMARIDPQRFEILLDNELRVEAAFRPQDETSITTALRDHNTAKLRIVGRGQYSSDGLLVKIPNVTSVEILPDGSVPFDESAQPLWEAFDEVTRKLPQTLLDILPSDGASQHDHYIYGTPRTQR